MSEVTGGRAVVELLKAEGVRYIFGIVGDGIQTDAELTALVDAVRRHLGAPGTLVLQPLLVQAWGRTPS